MALHTPGGPVTYEQLAKLVNRTGNALEELGVRQEERVLLALSDGVEFVAAWYGAQKIGAVTAEVYTFLNVKDFAYYLDYTRAGVVLVDATTIGAMREARHQLLQAGRAWPRALLAVGVPDGDLQPGEFGYDAVITESPAELDPAPTHPDDIALWKFTTGSTGMPKACVHRARTPYESFKHYARGVLAIHEDDVVLPVPKLFFGYARDLTALYPFGVGGAGVAFPERSSAAKIFELIERHRPTILVNVPTMMRSMLEEPDHDLSSLRLTTSAGEALPKELHQRWLDTFGVEVLDGIGSSEAYHIYISSRPGNARPGTLGEVVPGYEAHVVDDDGNALPANEIGRLHIKGPTTALMYWNAREKSIETYAGDVVMSGDLFSCDEDGFFRYHGRADDLLKVGGIWVAPQEIELCLAGHPDVAECAVVGYRDDGLEKARAYVVAHAGATPDAEQLKAHVRATLSPHKTPREVCFVDALPRTGSGKVDRRALRELQSDERAQRR